MARKFRVSGCGFQKILEACDPRNAKLETHSMATRTRSRPCAIHRPFDHFRAFLDRIDSVFDLVDPLLRLIDRAGYRPDGLLHRIDPLLPELDRITQRTRDIPKGTACGAHELFGIDPDLCDICAGASGKQKDRPDDEPGLHHVMRIRNRRVSRNTF